MTPQPTYKKFDADSPQFSEVGKAMHDHWFHPTAWANYQRQFTLDEISRLLQWMWHEQRALEAVIAAKDLEIKRLYDRQNNRDPRTSKF